MQPARQARRSAARERPGSRGVLPHADTAALAAASDADTMMRELAHA
jgi:hypothetical protein